MNKALVFAAVFAVTACSGSSGSDGGTGGSSAGGGTTSAGGGAAAGGGSGQGGGTATGGGTTSNNVPIAQLCTAVVNAECSYLVRCGAFSSTTACVTSLGEEGESLTTCEIDPVASVNAGRATYHGDQAALCINGLANADCQGFTALEGTSPACNATFVGTVAVNGTCVYDTDCVAGAFCEFATQGFCGGTCQQFLTAGQTLTGNDQCAHDLTAYNGVCMAPLAQGQSCQPTDGGFEPLPCVGNCTPFNLSDGGTVVLCAGGADAGALCTDPVAAISGCKSFGYCDQTTMLCTPLGGLNAACSSGTCQGDLWCDTTRGSPTCQPRSATGGACADNNSCLSQSCDGGMAQNPDGGASIAGACLALPGLNAPCMFQCAAGLYCDSQTSLCLTLEPDGQPCTNGGQCVSTECTSRDGGAQICGLCE